MSQTVAQKIKALRKSRGYSQEILCLKLDIPVSTYSYKERNNSFELHEIKQICDIFGCSFDTIVSDAPFNPLRLIQDEDTTLFMKEPSTKLGFRPDTEPTYLTDDEADKLRRIRKLDQEQSDKLFEYLKKIENGEI